MKNIKLENNKLVLEYDPAEARPSKSGKTLLIASTNGFKWIGDMGVSVNIIKRR